MAHELRVPEPDELEAFFRPILRGFGIPEPKPELLEDDLLVWEHDRAIGAVDGAGWVGGAGAFSFELTLPGGATAPAAGVTMVGVSATHRRRGILTSLMQHQLDDVAARGEALAILTASETGIYGRFGYGLASSAVEVAIDTAHAAYRPGCEPGAAGSASAVPVGEARGAIAEVYERCRLLRAGTLSRSDGWWERILRDREHRRKGSSGLFAIVHHAADGTPDGYVLHRMRALWNDSGNPAGTAIVVELVAVDDEVEAALFRQVLDLDLVTRVVAENRPVDDPLRWRLADPRRYETSLLADWLWLRVLDVEAALALRGYRVEDALVLDVHDAFRPDAGGRFLLEAGPDGATCTRTDRDPQLSMAADDLGALYLGGVSATALRRAARVVEHEPGAAARADALFAGPEAPFCSTDF